MHDRNGKVRFNPNLLPNHYRNSRRSRIALVARQIRWGVFLGFFGFPRIRGRFFLRRLNVGVLCKGFLTAARPIETGHKRLLCRIRRIALRRTRGLFAIDREMRSLLELNVTSVSIQISRLIFRTRMWLTTCTRNTGIARRVIVVEAVRTEALVAEAAAAVWSNCIECVLYAEHLVKRAWRAPSPISAVT